MCIRDRLNTMSSFVTRFANSENVVLAFLGQLLGGERTEQGMLDNTRMQIKEIEDQLSGSRNAVRMRQLNELKAKIESDRKELQRTKMFGTQMRYSPAAREEFRQNIRANLQEMQRIAGLDSSAFDATISKSQLNRQRMQDLERLRQQQNELQAAIRQSAESPSLVQNVSNETKQFMNQMTTFVTDQGDKLAKQLQIGD